MPQKIDPKNHGGKAGIIRNHISMSMRGWILRYPTHQIPTCPNSWSLVADKMCCNHGCDTHELRRSKPISLRNNQLTMFAWRQRHYLSIFKYISDYFSIQAGWYYVDFVLHMVPPHQNQCFIFWMYTHYTHHRAIFCGSIPTFRLKTKPHPPGVDPRSNHRWSQGEIRKGSGRAR